MQYYDEIDDEINVLGEKVKDGCLKSFNKIHKVYYSRFLYMACSRLEDRCLADEVVSDIFLKVWRKVHLWDNRAGNLSAWMFVIAKHAIIDASRKRARYYQMLKELEELDGRLDKFDMHQHRDLPAKHMQVLMSDQIVNELLPMVKNDDNKRAWKLVRLDGLSVAEVSDITQVAEGTVKIRAFRCAQEMRTLVESNPTRYGLEEFYYE